ncbi:unnamed protein product [Rotaria magnacalcarata]|uniref:HAT C-terminal dimerisation domain-containing protein n=1 Tax=Rotaria magnacalcarata TaxID=392030 RepID=A0A819J2K2_9BILA|nr:unnamed protein product [Rotaria magnacalcarata]CAF3925581.1 unnamed protein product [Rotaria magnacalcarata]
MSVVKPRKAGVILSYSIEHTAVLLPLLYGEHTARKTDRICIVYDRLLIVLFDRGRESLFVQIEKYIGDHEIEKQMVNEVFEELDDKELVNKIPTQAQNHQDSCHKIRPGQLWAFLITKTTTNCDEMTKLVSYVYSIPCSSAYTEGVFSRMKHL